MGLKEKDITDYLYNNWSDIFPEMIGCKKEFIFRNSRVDIFSSYPVDLYQLGIRDKDDIFRHTNAAVFVEIKHDNNDRDLLFELQKHINFRNWYIKYGKSYCYIMVMSDSYNEDMVKFMKENNIIMYKYKYTEKNNKIETIEIEEFIGEE